MIRVDCHCHTSLSWDGLIQPRRFIADALAAGMDAVIVCDHNTLAGYHRLQQLPSPLRLIPGMEVSTGEGDLLACFITESPPLNRPLVETIHRIHDLGGLVVIPHPFAWTALNRVKPPMLNQALELADAVEGINARDHIDRNDQRAREWAARYGKPITAGSDAHLPRRIGAAYLEMESFTDAKDFLSKLPSARPVLSGRANFLFHVAGFGCALARNGARRLGLIAAETEP